MFCGNCGYQLIGGDKFCGGCGQIVGQEPSPYLYQPPQSPVEIQPSQPPMEMQPPVKMQQSSTYGQSQGGGKVILKGTQKAYLSVSTVLLLVMTIPLFFTIWQSFFSFWGFGNPWERAFVGAGYYIEVIFGTRFGQLLVNTLALGVLPIIVTCLVAAILILCITNISNRWLKYTALTIIAIPAFVPIFAFNQIVIDLAMPTAGGLSRGVYWVVFSIFQMIRSAFIPTVIGVFVCAYNKRKEQGMFLSLALYALFSTLFILAPDFESVFTTSLYVPGANAETLNLYVYSTGFLRGQMSYGSAVWVIKTILQLVIGIGILFCLSLVWKNIRFASRIEDETTDSSNSPMALVGFAICSIPFLFIIFGYVFPVTRMVPATMALINNSFYIGSTLFNTITRALVGSVIFVIFAFFFAFPLTFRKRFYGVLLFLVAMISNNFIGNFFVISRLGLIGSPFNVPLIMGLSVMGVFGLYGATRNEFVGNTVSMGDYCRKVAPFLLGLFVVAFIISFGNSIHELLFISRSEDFGIGILGRNLFLGVAQPVMQVADYVFIASFIPVLLGIALIWTDAFLPKSMLPLFIASIRR